MYGIAAKIFSERHGRPLMDGRSQEHMSLLEQLQREQLLHSFELRASQNLVGDREESLQLAVAFLAMAMRHGHLSVRLQGGRLAPEPESLLREEDTSQGALIRSWSTAVKKGLSAIHGLSADASVCCHQANESTYYYLRRNWVLEQQLRDLLQKQLKNTPEWQFQEERVKSCVGELADRLLPEQRAAIEGALLGGLSVITGGPGTGKSYTAALFIRAFALLLEQQSGERKPQVALAAPTGKAAAALRKKLGSDGSSSLEVEEPRTLHALLKVGRDGRRTGDDTPLAADVVIVDECSMIDASLMAQLLKAVKPRARLLLLGDHDQLPPVEAGSLFSDMVEVLEKEGRVFALTRCVRAELQGIVELAAIVNRSDGEELGSFLHHPPAGISWHSLDDRAAEKAVVERLLRDLPLVDDPDIVADHFARQRLLAPLRKGLGGLSRINEVVGEQHLQRAIKRGLRDWYAPVVVVKNDYTLGIYNGETGLLQRPLKGRGSRARDRILLRDTEGEWRSLSAGLVSGVELAYCLSVHKSQGSEFENLILLLPSSATTFGKEIVYTGITRAKRQVSIYATLSTLKKALSFSSRRVSGFASLPL